MNPIAQLAERIRRRTFGDLTDRIAHFEAERLAVVEEDIEVHEPAAVEQLWCAECWSPATELNVPAALRLNGRPLCFRHYSARQPWPIATVCPVGGVCPPDCDRTQDGCVTIWGPVADHEEALRRNHLESLNGIESGLDMGCRHAAEMFPQHTRNPQK